MHAGLHQVVTFASHVFHGNPAYVLTLLDTPDPAAMTSVAALIGADVLAVVSRISADVPRLSFFTPEGPHPGAGHATQGAAHVALHATAVRRDALSFKLTSGDHRTVRRAQHGIAVDWSVMPYEATDRHADIADALGVYPAECFVAAFGYVAVLETEAEVAQLAPILDRVAKLDRTALIVTAPGAAGGIVIRVFAPQAGLPEDPVCGTAHRIIVPYWATRLGTPEIHSRHLSKRGGDLWCSLAGDTVTISGESVTAFEGLLRLPD